jgi:hypothetical protein
MDESPCTAEQQTRAGTCAAARVARDRALESEGILGERELG